MAKTIEQSAVFTKSLAMNIARTVERINKLPRWGGDGEEIKPISRGEGGADLPAGLAGQVLVVKVDGTQPVLDYCPAGPVPDEGGA